MNHPHEVKMDMGHHEVKMDMGHREVKMDMRHHEMHEVKMDMTHHDVKMNSMHHPHDMKLIQSLELKINHNHHNDTLHNEVPVIPQTHLIEVHLPIEQQEMSQMEMEVNNVQQNEPAPPPQQQRPQETQKQENKSNSKADKKKKEAIDGQAREVIFKVIKFFESEKQNRGYAFPVENVVKRACAATGLSESTIKRIKRDGLRAEATQTRMTGPKKKRVRKTKVQLDYFQLCALRGIVNGYSNRKEVPTLGKILAAAKHELNYRGGKESLRLILLNKLGIKFKKCEKKNKKPPEESPPPMQQMQNIMPPPQVQHMKVLENQCVYTNMIPPVSY